MASQKRNRSASGQGAIGGAATRPGSGSPGRPGSGNPGNPAGRGGTKQADRQSNRARSGAVQNGAVQNGRAQNGRAQNGRAQNGRDQNGRDQNRRPGQGRAGFSQGRSGGQVTEPAVGTADIPFSVPPWIQWTSLVLSLAGLGVSIYMTIAHYTSTNILVCSSNGYIDCAKVTTSTESMVFNVFPVAVLGLAFYVFMTAVNTPWAWRSGIAVIWWARLAGIITGMGFVLYLIYAEVIQIGNLCLDCTSVHVITFLLFGLLIFAASLRSPASSRAS